MTLTPAPDASPLICGKFDCRDMRVCRNCGQLFGPCRELGCNNETVQVLEQVCSCQAQRQSQQRWPRYDFNEAVTLCYCCGSKLLPSGSKWSVWFCDECKSRVDTINDLCSKYVVPIGRHSNMASKNRTGSVRAEDDPHIEAFTSTLRDIGQRIELLIHHEKRVVADTLEKQHGLHSPHNHAPHRPSSRRCRCLADPQSG
jgi:hypothetical protein